MNQPYEYSIEARPEFAILNVNIPAGQTLKVEASAMASMDSNIQMRTKLRGGFKRFLVRESLFINEFTAKGGPGEIKIAPGPAGDICHYSLKSNEQFFLTGSSYVASTPGVILDTKFQGLAKGFFSGESLFLMACSGEGDLWFNTYGALFKIDVREEYIVDTGHIVAFSEGLDYTISKIGGYKSLFFSGEGFVCRFRGEGEVYLQTRNPLGLISWAQGFRRVKSSN